MAKKIRTFLRTSLASNFRENFFSTWFWKKIVIYQTNVGNTTNILLYFRDITIIFDKYQIFEIVTILLVNNSENLYKTWLRTPLEH